MRRPLRTAAVPTISAMGLVGAACGADATGPISRRPRSTEEITVNTGNGWPHREKGR